MWQMLLGPVIELANKVIDGIIPDQNKANELKAAFSSQLLSSGLEELKAAVQVIVAEAQGDSWLQRNWRPITMLTFTALVVAKWLGLTAPGVTEAIEVKLLEIVQVGLGGYVIGRSVEKAVKAWKS